MRRVALRPLGASPPVAGPAVPSDEPAPPPPPDSVELGPAGAPLGIGTAADFEAEVSVPSPPAGRSGVGRIVGRLPSRRRGPAPPALLRNERFRIFWRARLATQTG